MMIALALFSQFCLLAVIAALLRQLNKEREERFALINHYANMAMQVRWRESGYEDPYKDIRESYYMNGEGMASSVQEVEGVL